MPMVSGKEMIKFLTKQGFEGKRRKSGESHVRMIHSDVRRTTVSLHSELDIGTLNAILSQTEISREQFIQDF